MACYAISAQAELYFHKQNPVSIPRLVASIHRLVDATPVDFLSALRRRAGLGSDGRGSDDQQTTSLQTNTPVVVLPSSAEDPWPIPVGHYPMFEGYPKYVVDYQIRERARIAVEEEEIKRKRQFLEELTKRSEELNRAEQVGRESEVGAGITMASLSRRLSFIDGFPVGWSWWHGSCGKQRRRLCWNRRRRGGKRLPNYMQRGEKGMKVDEQHFQRSSC